MKKNIFIAATSQHVGKTTSTLGLVAALRQKDLKVGYCKPVGQEFVDLGKLLVDKDALLFSTVMDFQLASEIHSPVILGKGATSAYLDNPSAFPYRERIIKAEKILQAENDIVVYEGTGHTGVGSVVDLSNADVAKLLNAGVVMVAPGGVGKTIDLLNTHLALFREQNVPIIGVIINKVLPKKLDKVRHYVGLKLKQMGIPLLGVLPYDQTLANPIMHTISQAVHGKTLLNQHRLGNKVENVISGALIEKEEIESLQNLLLIVNRRRLDNAVEIMEKIALKEGLTKTPFSGIIIHGEDEITPAFIESCTCKDYIKHHEIPLIATSLDTYGSAICISKIEVKINIRTPWKSQRAIEMIHKHVNLDAIMAFKKS